MLSQHIWDASLKDKAPTKSSYSVYTNEMDSIGKFERQNYEHECMAIGDLYVSYLYVGSRLPDSYMIL